MTNTNTNAVSALTTAANNLRASIATLAARRGTDCVWYAGHPVTVRSVLATKREMLAECEAAIVSLDACEACETATCACRDCGAKCSHACASHCRIGGEL